MAQLNLMWAIKLNQRKAKERKKERKSHTETAQDERTLTGKKKNMIQYNPTEPK